VLDEKLDDLFGVIIEEAMTNRNRNIRPWICRPESGRTHPIEYAKQQFQKEGTLERYPTESSEASSSHLRGQTATTATTTKEKVVSIGRNRL
jgi:hypothetical protein